MALPSTMKVLGLIPGLGNRPLMEVLCMMLLGVLVELQVCVMVNNISVLVVYMIIIGDVQGWFGAHWWNGRFFVLLVTTLDVFAPSASLKRISIETWSRKQMHSHNYRFPGVF